MIIDSLSNSFIAKVMAPALPSESLFYLYLLSSVLISFFVYLGFSKVKTEHRPEKISSGFFQYLFDPKVWLHKSALQDYIFFFVGSFLYSLAAAYFLVSGHVVYELFGDFFESTFGNLDEELFSSTPLSILGYTLLAVLSIDLAIYITHYVQHKIQVLWHFHSVHHSAEVLTIITVYRQHPVDLLITGTLMVVIYQFAFAAFGYLTMSEPGQYTVAGVNIVIFFAFILGYNLRHSHIWLSYPPWLSHILISPAQHQTHHSIDEKHFDKNFGFIFAIWDWMFGTLYVPKGYENLSFGISKEEPNPFRHRACIEAVSTCLERHSLFFPQVAC
jgi:sterol desaturase/sphingolipid hydroxylase (fatty acid hydroxylase superfamily)